MTQFQIWNLKKREKLQYKPIKFKKIPKQMIQT